MSLKIRKATPKDLPAVRELASRFYVEEKRKHDPELIGDFPLREAGKKEYQRLLNSRKAITFLAEEAGTPHAYIIATVDRVKGPWEETRCVIYELFIDKTFRRKGVGKRLVAKAKAWAKERGADVLLVTAYSNNRAARRFYAAGFEEWSTTFHHRLKRR